MFEARNLNILNKSNKIIFPSNISFCIQENEIWRFKGPNGIGKSSFYEALIGLRPIYQGEILLNSKSLNRLKPTDRIALGLKYIPQKNAFFNDLSIFQNLSICTYYLCHKSKKNDMLEKAIKTFELSEFVHKLPTQLSGGQQRLAELSKLLIGNFKLALIDEPFAALDINTIQKVCNIFSILKEEGMSLLINDHNLKAIEEIADHDISLTQNNVKIIMSKNTTK